MKSPLRILVIEDDRADYQLLRMQLQRQSLAVEMERIGSLAELEAALDRQPCDVVLSDYKIPGLDFEEIVRVLQTRREHLPLILVSGFVGEERVVQLLKLGVWDFVSKENLARLPIAIEHSVRDAENRKARQAAEQRLVESEARFRALFDYSPEGILLADAEDRRILFGNEAIRQLLGYGAEELPRLTVAELHPESSRVRAMGEFAALIRGEKRFVAALPMLRKDGSEFLADIGASSFQMEGRLCLAGFFHDTTERNRAERLEALSCEVLRILNDPRAAPNATQRILDAIHRETGIEAVGIRIRQGEDFPYAAAQGFSSAFIRAENSLAMRTPEGSFCLDDQGNVRLECTCGLVLTGGTDPSNPLFTPGGSAWTNDAEPLIEAPADADPRLNLRNRCIHEGFRSVALIPIRVEGEIVGLLQLNDRRKKCFSAETVRYLEGLAGSFGVALLRLREEEALREAERKYRGIFENAVEGVFQTTSVGGVRSANPAMASLLGYASAEELVAEASDFTRIFFSNPDQRQDFFRRLEAEGFVREFEHEVTRKDGELAWVSSNLRAVRDGGGGSAGYEGTVADITARKRAEAQLRERERQLATLMANLPGMAYRCQNLPDWPMIFVSEGSTGLTGYSPAELMEDRPAYGDAIVADDREGVWTRVQDALVRREPFELTYRIQAADGEIKWMWERGRGVFSEEGGLLFLEGFISDISELKRAQQGLESALVKYRTLFDTFPLGITVSDREGRIVESNRVAEAILGLSAEVQARRSIDGPEWNLLRPDGTPMPASEYASVRAAREQRVIQDVEMGIPRSPRETTWISATAAPVQLPDVGVVITYTDITERKRLESQLRQAQKLEAVGQLAGGIAHDFNNILAAILMHLGLLQTSPALDEETRQSLKDLDAEARRAATLTRQLLMFSRRSVLSIRPLDLNEVVANLLKMLIRLIGENVQLRFEGASALPAVAADAGMMEQVLMNLVVNARDAMPRGGRITISTDLATLIEADLAGNPNRRTGQFACLAVSDTGTGMEEATLKKVFEPFFTTKEPGKGTGLGLATVHGIVAQHKGWVEVASVLGQGSTFRVHLPALGASSRPADAEAPPKPLPRGRETILLVEDEGRVRQSVGQALRVLGYRVLEAANGQEALRLWQIHGATVDLLFTDMVMPEGMSGLELAERLRGAKPNLLAIVSSGYSPEIAQTGSPARRGLTYLPKPYDLAQLAEVVRHCLESASETGVR